MASKRKRKPCNLIPHEPVVHQNLRLPKSLHRAIKAAARKNRTSMHAEILRRLANTSAVAAATLADFIKLLRADIDEQAQAWTAPQNGHSASQRPPQSRDGGEPA